MQADILNLDKIEMKFDIVESVGVLHHMDNPINGWKILTNCLKPGGLMRIGLYSEIARQHITKTRLEIEKSGIGTNPAEMKSFRNKLKKSSMEHHKEILKSSDFYSLSNFRDLLFHVQEHCFTLQKIQNCLDKLNLRFCGFEGNDIIHNFKVANIGVDDPYDLEKWSTFEKDNPLIFRGMYQFWCQKIS